MKTNPEALKKLYVAMGGDETDVANLNVTPDMIEALADIYEGGGGAGLPEVTAADNGDVLTVVNGEWDKATAAKELPSVSNADNGKALWVENGKWDKGYDPAVEYVYFENDGGTWSTITSFERVKALYGRGKQPVALADVNMGGGSMRVVCPIVGVTLDNNSVPVKFHFAMAAPAAVNDQLTIMTGVIVYSADGTISAGMGMGTLNAE